MLQRAQPALLAEALAGRVSPEEFAAIIGAPLLPAGSAEEIAASAMNTPLYQKQFINHRLTHYYVIPGAIDGDRVGEADIDGRCSNQKMTNSSSAPSIDVNYWTDSQGRVQTYSRNGYSEYVKTPTGYC